LKPIFSFCHPLSPRTPYSQGEGPAIPFLREVVAGMDLSQDRDDATKAWLVGRFAESLTGGAGTA
jgi:hypothetical protein